MTRDPYLLLAIQAYKREPVTLAQLAGMLGIGEKAFSKIVKLNVARRGKRDTHATSGERIGEVVQAIPSRICPLSVTPDLHRGAGVAPCRHIQFHTTPSVAGRTEL